jgi:hypothetical protein
VQLTLFTIASCSFFHSLFHEALLLLLRLMFLKELIDLTKELEHQQGLFSTGVFFSHLSSFSLEILP